MLYSINWPNFVVWLSLPFELLGNMCIGIICCPACEVMNFEINHGFLINPFFLIPKKSRQNYKYLKNEKIFIILKEPSLKQIKAIFWKVRVT